MGWTFGYGTTRSELIKELTAVGTFCTNAVLGDYTINPDRRSVCLAHCTRGNVLWSVWSVQNKENSEGEWKEEARYIGCDLMARSKEGWGNKSLSETSHPFYYTCPLAYLEMVPCPPGCEEWRETVRQEHAKACRARLLAEGQLVEFKDEIRFTNGYSENKFYVHKNGRKMRFESVRHGFMATISGEALKRDFTIYP